MAQGQAVSHIIWGDGGGGGKSPCCLICLGALPRRGPSSGAGQYLNLFLNACELLNVPFDEIRTDWNFGGGGGGGGSSPEKLPFCLSCYEAIEAVKKLKQQFDDLQKRITAGLQNIRKRIHQTSGKDASGMIRGQLPLRVYNFRTRALKSEFPHVAVNPPNPNLTCINPANQQITPSWAPHPPPEHLYTSPSQLHHNYVSPSPSSLQSESPNTPFNSGGFRVIHSTSSTENISTIQAPAPPSSNNDDITDDYFDEYDNTATSPEHQIPSKRSHQSSSQTTPSPKKPRGRPRSTSSSTPKTPQSISIISTPRKSPGSSGTSSRQAEYFAPIETDSSGQMTFEGILITPIPTGGYLCGLCSATCGKAHNSISIRKIKIHIKGFHLGAYKCQICDKNFTSNDILSQHITRTHEVGDRPCDICLKPIRPRYMLLHKYTHMNAEEKAALIATGFKPPISSFDKEKRFPCPQCGTMFKKMTNLRIHERIHMDEKTRPRHSCLHCEKSYTNTQSLKEHVQRAHSDNLTIKAELRRREICKICGKSVFSRVMSRHLKTHVATENRPFACKICGKRFQDDKMLKKHEGKFHKDGKTKDQLPFECDICGKRSETLKQIRAHRRRVHRNNWKSKIPADLVGDVTVDSPGEDFMLLEDLNNEGLQHVEKNLYSFHLYQVEKLEEGDGGSGLGSNLEKFKCCTCFKVFEGEGDELEERVKKHVREEHVGNFRCNLCTKRMKNLTEVVAHKRAEHLDMDSYNCAVCLKPGIPRKSVRGHQFSHKGVYEAAEAINRGMYLPGRGNVSQGDMKLEEREEILRGFGEVLCYKCKDCESEEVEFDRLEELDGHRRRVHANKVKIGGGDWEGEEVELKDVHCLNEGEKRGGGRGKKRGRKPKERGEVVKRGRKRTKKDAASTSTKAESLVKTEMVTDDEEEDLDLEESELELNDDSESDPEFRSKIEVKVTTTEGRRTSLRQRKVKYIVEADEGDYDDDDDMTTEQKENDNYDDDVDVGVGPSEGAEAVEPVEEGEAVAVKVELSSDEENKEDGGDGEDGNNVWMDKDLKLSPHSSDVEGGGEDEVNSSNTSDG